MRVDADHVSVHIDNTPIVHDATIAVASGSFVGIIGPNGSSKTTMLKSIHRALRPVRGSITVGGDDLWELSAQQSARRTSVVLQDDASEFAFTVRETVETGRLPHKRLFERQTSTDGDAIDDALETAGVAHLSDRLVGTLSGGERQRVFVARALAQCAAVMVLDEPTNHLDISAQIDLLELLTSLPLTVVAALHDLNLAAAYCDDLYVMAAGRVIAHGPPAVVLTPEMIGHVYGVAAHCSTHPLTGKPLIAFAPARTVPPTLDPPLSVQQSRKQNSETSPPSHRIRRRPCDQRRSHPQWVRISHERVTLDARRLRLPGERGQLRREGQVCAGAVPRRLGVPAHPRDAGRPRIGRQRLWLHAGWLRRAADGLSGDDRRSLTRLRAGQRGDDRGCPRPVSRQRRGAGSR